jgi:hypothetical protein
VNFPTVLAITVGSTLGGTIGSHIGATESARMNRAIAVGALGAIFGAWITSPAPQPKTNPQLTAGTVKGFS